jgi:hypothetical protein
MARIYQISRLIVQIWTINRFALVQWGAATVFWLEYVYKVQVVCILVLLLTEIARDLLK